MKFSQRENGNNQCQSYTKVTFSSEVKNLVQMRKSDIFRPRLHW